MELSERVKKLRDLSRECGGIERVSDEQLAVLRYVRYQDNGVDVVLPEEKLAERLGAKSLSEYLQARREVAEVEKTPLFNRVDVVTQQSAEEYGSVVPANVLLKQLNGLEEKLLIIYGGDFGEWLAYDDPARQVGNYLSELASRRFYRIPDTDFYVRLSSLYPPEKIAEDLLWNSSEHKEQSFGVFEYPVANRLSIDADPTRPIPPEVAEAAWRDLERQKSLLTDPDNILVQFDENSLCDFVVADPLDILSAKQGKLTSEEIEEFPFSVDQLVENGELTRVDHDEPRMATILLAEYLSVHGLGELAEQVAAYANITDLRAALPQLIADNPIVTATRAQERELRQKLAGTQGEERYHLSAELSGLKKELKERLRPLREVSAFLSLPERYMAAAKREITDLQKMLLRKGDGEAVQALVTLDGTPDAEKDADPGKMSGDCTEGRPLPFDRYAHAHNIKAYIRGGYQGNIYLLDTIADNGKKAWHLDAIQIPDASLDWDVTVVALRDKLAELAESHGVELVTINTDPHHISNYDYIANAFLKMAGAKNYDYQYGHMAYADQDKDNEIAAPRVRVKFPPKMGDEYSQFQGAGSDQIIIWQAAREA